MNVLLQSLRAAPSLRPRTALCVRTYLTTPQIPTETSKITSPEVFLKAIGRSSESKFKAEGMEWKEFWKHDGKKLKAAGVNVRDRRYILWCMQKYRLRPLDEAIQTFAHEPPPPKKVRGWGPKRVDGKLIRSRRDRANPPAPKRKKTDAQKDAKKARKRAFRLKRDGPPPQVSL
ncbi:IGR domain-containing protein [Mycena kentingensis (nom. inval.)]|nr:IGR domain-containing protein [Mycena kentingensis (nom. inval.)]